MQSLDRAFSGGKKFIAIVASDWYSVIGKVLGGVSGEFGSLPNTMLRF
jgi:hypothetical protein